jgi:hypothetical protein
MADPFLDIATFTGMFRPLSTAETADATTILQVTSDWIRTQPSSRAPLPDNDSGAALVVFEVTRDQLQLGQFAPLSRFQNTTSLRTEEGEINKVMLEQVITDRQKRILGIPLRAAPASNFVDSNNDALWPQWWDWQ